MVQRILRRPEFERVTGMSRSTIYAEMDGGFCPKPIPTGQRSVGWLEDDAELLQAARIAERDGRLDEFIAERRAERGSVEPWLIKIAERVAQRRGRPRRPMAHAEASA